MSEAKESKKPKQFTRTYDYDNGAAVLTLPDGTVLAKVEIGAIASEVVNAFVLQKAIGHLANAYTGAMKKGKDAAKRVEIAMRELVEGEVSFRDGSGGESAKGSLYDVAEVLVELGFTYITFPDKSKREFFNVDEAYATLKALWAAPAVDGGPAGKGIYQKIKTHPKVAAALAEGEEPGEDVLG